MKPFKILMGFSEIFERKRFPGDFHLGLDLYKRKNKRIGMPADEEFRGVGYFL